MFSTKSASSLTIFLGFLWMLVMMVSPTQAAPALTEEKQKDKSVDPQIWVPPPPPPYRPPWMPPPPPPTWPPWNPPPWTPPSWPPWRPPTWPRYAEPENTE